MTRVRLMRRLRMLAGHLAHRLLLQLLLSVVRNAADLRSRHVSRGHDCRSSRRIVSTSTSTSSSGAAASIFCNHHVRC